MLEAYRQHVAERAALGIPPLPLDAEQTSYSFLPVVEAFTKTANVSIETADISLAGRIIATFPEYLTPEQQQTSALCELLQHPPAGEDANLIALYGLREE